MCWCRRGRSSSSTFFCRMSSGAALRQGLADALVRQSPDSDVHRDRGLAMNRLRFQPADNMPAPVFDGLGHATRAEVLGRITCRLVPDWWQDTFEQGPTHAAGLRGWHRFDGPGVAPGGAGVCGGRFPRLTPWASNLSLLRSLVVRAAWSRSVLMGIGMRWGSRFAAAPDRTRGHVTVEWGGDGGFPAPPGHRVVLGRSTSCRGQSPGRRGTRAQPGIVRCGELRRRAKPGVHRQHLGIPHCGGLGCWTEPDLRCGWCGALADLCR